MEEILRVIIWTYRDRRLYPLHIKRNQRRAKSQRKIFALSHDIPVERERHYGYWRPSCSTIWLEGLGVGRDEPVGIDTSYGLPVVDWDEMWMNWKADSVEYCC